MNPEDGKDPQIKETSLQNDCPTFPHQSSPNKPIKYNSLNDCPLLRIRLIAFTVATTITFCAYKICQTNISTESDYYSSLLAPAHLNNIFFDYNFNFDLTSSALLDVSEDIITRGKRVGLHDVQIESFSNDSGSSLIRLGSLTMPSRTLGEETTPIEFLKTSIEFLNLQLDLVKSTNVDILVLEEFWNMPSEFLGAINSRQIIDQTNNATQRMANINISQFAELYNNSATLSSAKALARKWSVSLVVPFLEKVPGVLGGLMRSVVFINSSGDILGHQKSNHDRTFIANRKLDHKVFDTEYGRIGLDLREGGSTYLNMLRFGIKDADIIISIQSLLSQQRQLAIAPESIFVAAASELGIHIFSMHRLSSDLTRRVLILPNGSHGQTFSFAGLSISQFDLNLGQQVRSSVERSFDTFDRIAEYIPSFFD